MKVNGRREAAVKPQVRQAMFVTKVANEPPCQ